MCAYMNEKPTHLHVYEMWPASPSSPGPEGEGQGREKRVHTTNERKGDIRRDL